jgi:hypothetical protein
MKLSLKDWHHNHTKNLDSKIMGVKSRIAQLDEKGEQFVLQDVEITELHDLSLSLHSLSRVQNSITWQKSRMHWLNEGDANTKFFHGMMSHMRRNNYINLLSVGGVVIEGVQNNRTTVYNHFSSHFQATGEERPSVYGLPFRQLSFGEAGNLTRPFSIEEVKQAIWDLLKDDFMRLLVEIHRNGKLTKGLNSTFIALIPKVNSPQHLDDFRPISLVGYLYKVLAKVLANRLRLVIGSVVSDSQSSFVKGKQILDGILIANEVVDEARRSGKELMLFNVDFEKAYDSVDLKYLDAVMV